MKRYLYRFLGMTCLSVFLSTTAFTQHIEQAKRLNTSELRSEEAVTSFDTNSESNQSPLEQYSGKREDLSKRDLFSKHFINEDGSYTAIIGAGPIHYEKNGEFLDIDHTVVTNSSSEFPFANTTNLMESYFGATSAAGIRSVTAEGEVREFLNTRLYWEVDGQPYEIEEAANVPASIVSGNGVVYPNLFGNISAEYTVLTGKRELNYVIPNAQALGAIPANATYLVFAEDIELPMGWAFEENNSGILLKSANGNNVYLYENPNSTDTQPELLSEGNTHFATELNGNILTVYTKVKTEWLLGSERVYPVKVDPTTNVWGNTTGAVSSTGFVNFSGRANDIVSGIVNVSGTNREVNGFAKFTVSSIPVGSTINSAVTTTRIYSNTTYSTNGHVWGSCYIDPATATAAQIFGEGATTYWVGLPYSGGSNGTLATQTLNPTALTELASSLSQGWFAMLMFPTGNDWSFSYAEYLELWGQRGTTNVNNTNHRPYLNVNYTAAAACSGTPTGGTTNLSPSSGTQGSSFTASVSGSSTDSGLTYQWESGPTSSGPWSNVSGQTGTTASLTAPSTNGTVYYRRKITCTSSGQSAYSTSAAFTTSCTPSHTSGNCAAPGDCQYIGISNVTFGSINNSTGYYNSSPSYNDYSGMTTDVSEGNNYQLSVKYNDNGGNLGKLAAWIDWAGDGSFSGPNDFLGVYSSVGNNNTKIFSFSVPGGTTAGSKRLRVRVVFNEETLTVSDACSVKEYGETEDYRVNVQVINFECSTLDNLVASIGDPANGTAHHLDLNWDAIAGSTAYDVQFSTDGSTYNNAAPASVPNNYAETNAGDYPDTPYWFRVRAKNATETCDWTYVGPIYTAADLPEVPLITNAAGTSLDLTLQAETPVANPAITTYSIVCPTTGQFVQANGTLGATEVFQTKAQWGTITVTGLTTNSSYCFYAKAKNQDGHIVSGESTISGVETFASTANFSNQVSNGPTNKWWTPGSPTSGNPMVYSATGGCGDGYVGFSGSWHNYFGSFLRSPQQNCNGLDQVTLTVDLSNSYIASHPNNKFTFNMWAPTASNPSGAYINASSVNGVAGYTLSFNQVRDCETVTVVYNLSNVTDKSAIMFYVNVDMMYNDSNVDSFKIDNISFSMPAETACATLTAAVAPKFYDYGGSTQLAFNNSRSDNGTPVFRLSHSMGTATDYQIEINTSPAFSAGGTTQTFSGSYPANTQANFTFTNATLSNGTTYYVRARINTGLGYGAWTSGTYSFTYSTTQDSPDWFQTTQAQFQTGTLSGTEANGSHNVVATITGGGSGAMTNANFNGNTNGWTITGANTSWNLYASAIGSSDGVCPDCNPLPGATNLRMGSPLFGTSGPINGDRIIVAQQVDLTGVSSISFDVSAWYNLGNPFYSEASTVLKFKIGGTLTNATGGLVDMTVQTQPSSYSYTSPHTVTVNTEGISGVQVVKFVLEYNAQWHGNGLIMYYVSGVSANESASGTITSPTIYLASKQNAPAWEELAWNQTLNGGAITLKIQKVVSGTWTDVSGLDNISANGNGLKTYDISALGSEDSIRVVATLTGASSPTLHDWAVSAGGCAAPQFTAELANAMTACTSGTAVLSATVEGSQPMTYQWQVSTNGGSSWGNVPAISIYNGINTPSLSIINPIPAYNGNLYRLKISNDCGSVISGTCTLAVQVCPANDHPTSGAGMLTSTNYVYPNCYQVNGSTVNATINPATGEKDVWYRFEAFSNGTSIRVSSTTMDAKVYLFDSANLSAPLKVVNQIQGGGTEILNYDGLTAGHLYRIAVTPADGVEGDFQICLQQLRVPLCDKTGTMSLCDLFKIKPTGATNINVSFTDDNENTVSTTTSTFVTLSQESLGLKPEWNYSVGLIANYNLVDGLGNPEPIVVTNPEACSITIAPHALVEVKANQRCGTLAVLPRNSYLNATVIGASSVCGANGYKIEFVEMDGCSGQSIALPVEKTILGTLPQVHMTYLFPNAGYSSMTGVGYWKVRWKPRFANGYYGTYGPAHVIAVNGTAPGAGMVFDPSEASNGLTTGENIAANIYPNPNNGDMVNINVAGVNGNDVYVRILDAMGKEVYSNRFEAEGSLNTIVSFSKPLASGLYMVEFRNGDNIITQRMMVSK